MQQPTVGAVAGGITPDVSPQKQSAAAVPLEPRLPGEESPDVDELPDAPPLAQPAPPPVAALQLAVKPVRTSILAATAFVFLVVST